MFGNMNTNAMMDKLFKKMDNVVLDLQTGQMAIKKSDDSLVTASKSEDGDWSVDLNPFDMMSMPLPAFAQNTPMEQVKEGDLVVMNGVATGWVTEVKAKTVMVLKTDGQITRYNPPKVSTMGMSKSMMVVRSMMGDQLQGLQGSLMPMVMMSQMSGNDSGMGDLEDMLPMMMMSQGGMFGGQQSGSGADMGNMMQNMMMMKMMSKLK